MTDARDATRARLDGGARQSWHPAEIVSVAPLTSRVVSIKLRPETWRAVLPGQHIDVQLTAADGYRAHRSYSVASPPSDTGVLELVIERLNDGELSTYFHDSAAPGDTVEIRGPFAEHFVWRTAEPGPVFLAAGGSGVAPFLSMVRERAHLEHPPAMVLLYSARTWDDVIYREELLAHERAQHGLQLAFCLTRDAARRAADFSRRVDRDIIAAVRARLSEPPRQSFICGANSFVRTVADLLVEAGLPSPSIRTERYGGD